MYLFTCNSEYTFTSVYGVLIKNRSRKGVVDVIMMIAYHYSRFSLKAVTLRVYSHIL
jgi:hypothetical protein